ncbi:MAG: MarR family transcriptional regulator [Acidobacteria bacterium]|nr:MarR family transcriptional regulator [Acidobacteriota bacterium]
MDDQAADFRRFTRMYTRLIGVLDEGLLATPYSLAEARVIYELATGESPKAKDVAEALGLDPGYLSRILTKLEKAGLARRSVSKEDSRAARLALTRKGRAAFKTLDERSNQQAAAVLDRLLYADRDELIRSMKAIERILTGRADAPYVLRPHRAGDMGFVTHREAVVYAAEYGFDDTFEALVAKIVSDFVTKFDARRERCWIAEVSGAPVGHIFLVKHPERPDTAKLRLLFVEPSARGKGLGHALVGECVRFAQSAGYRKVTLWTQSVLGAAHRIYQQAGFQLVSEAPHHSFGQDLIGQTWELDLDGYNASWTSSSDRPPSSTSTR